MWVIEFMSCPVFYVRVLAFLLEYQWKAGALIWGSQRNIECSLGSGGLPRRFFVDGVEAFYYNPRLGLLTLSEYGALLVYRVMPSGFKRVVVNGGEFFKHSRGDVLVPLVRWITPDVRYGDEVFVVDEEDLPLAVGKALLGAYEFKTGPRRGEVVRIRRRLRLEGED